MVITLVCKSILEKTGEAVTVAATVMQTKLNRQLSCHSETTTPTRVSIVEAGLMRFQKGNELKAMLIMS